MLDVTHFGALPDGSASCRDIINDLIGRVNSDPLDRGKAIYFPPGTYKIDLLDIDVGAFHLIVRSGYKVTFVGAGRERTVLSFNPTEPGARLGVLLGEPCELTLRDLSLVEAPENGLRPSDLNAGDRLQLIHAVHSGDVMSHLRVYDCSIEASYPIKLNGPFDVRLVRTKTRSAVGPSYLDEHGNEVLDGGNVAIFRGLDPTTGLTWAVQPTVVIDECELSAATTKGHPLYPGAGTACLVTGSRFSEGWVGFHQLWHGEETDAADGFPLPEHVIIESCVFERPLIYGLVAQPRSPVLISSCHFSVEEGAFQVNQPTQVTNCVLDDCYVSPPAAPIDKPLSMVGCVFKNTRGQENVNRGAQIYDDPGTRVCAWWISHSLFEASGKISDQGDVFVGAGLVVLRHNAMRGNGRPVMVNAQSGHVVLDDCEAFALYLSGFHQFGYDDTTDPPTKLVTSTGDLTVTLVRSRCTERIGETPWFKAGDGIPWLALDAAISGSLAWKALADVVPRLMGRENEFPATPVTKTVGIGYLVPRAGYATTLASSTALPNSENFARVSGTTTIYNLFPGDGYGAGALLFQGPFYLTGEGTANLSMAGTGLGKIQYLRASPVGPDGVRTFLLEGSAGSWREV